MLHLHDLGQFLAGTPKAGAALPTNLSTARERTEKSFEGNRLSIIVKNRSKELC
jgi:hypothetical protein